jgi:hypothetical protein
MKKSEDKFEWTEEAHTAFAQLKKVLSTPPVLVAPKEKEPLLLYRDFYFRALGSLVVLSFPQVVSFSSVFPKPLSETLRRSSDGRIPGS